MRRKFLRWLEARKSPEPAKVQAEASPAPKPAAAKPAEPVAPVKVNPEDQAQRGYASGKYWKERSDLLYYRYIEYMIRTLGPDAKSLIDIGSGNSPYLEWFGWIERRVSVDIRVPYSSENVEGIQGDVHELELDRFDICTCLQVLEHVPDAEPFARRLLELGKTVVISVPYKWPAGTTKGHVHDPVTYEKLTDWVGREANYKIVVEEPFNPRKRLIAVYDQDPARKFGKADREKRVRL